MDDAMRARFVKALEAIGITKGKWADASVAVKRPDGRPLGKTFLRDAIMRGKGKDEFVEMVCRHYGISWDYVKFNKGPAAPLALIGGPRSALDDGSQLPRPIDPVKLIVAMEGAFRMLGASQQRAERLARECLSISQGRELSD